MEANLSIISFALAGDRALLVIVPPFSLGRRSQSDHPNGRSASRWNTRFTDSRNMPLFINSDIADVFKGA